MDENTETPVTGSQIKHRATALNKQRKHPITRTTEEHGKVKRPSFTTVTAERLIQGVKGSAYRYDTGDYVTKRSLIDYWRLVRDARRRHLSPSRTIVKVITPRTTARQRRLAALWIRGICVVIGGIVGIIFVLGLVWHILLAILSYIGTAWVLIAIIAACAWGVNFSVKLEGKSKSVPPKPTTTQR